jgi:hypothetical protein
VSKTTQPEWVVLVQEGLFCRRCGRREKLFPMEISEKRVKAMTLIGEAFSEEHARCVESENSPSRRAGRSPEEWLRGGDTGTSSLTIWHVMTGLPVDRVGEPIDPSDFGRCYRLLKLFPDWRPRLPEVAAKYPDSPWPALVREWDRMTALYEEELPKGTAPKLYALMKRFRAEPAR